MDSPFIYNDCNICDNPIEIELYDDKNFYAKIKVAEKDDKWSYGYTYMTKGAIEGCGLGASGVSCSNFSESFSTQEEAEEAAGNFLIKMFGEDKKHPNGTSTKKVIEAINDYLNKIKGGVMAKIKNIKPTKLGRPRKEKAAETKAEANAAEMVIMIPLSKIIPSKTNPRTVFDEAELEELRDSIKIHGVIQPITVRTSDDKYEIIAGERRYRATKLAGLKEIPGIIKEFTDEQVGEIQIIENLQRADVHPIDEAAGYKRLMDNGNYSIKTLASQVGKSDEYIAQRLKLVDLTDGFKEDFREGKITLEHAKLLSRLTPADQANADDYIKRNSFSGETVRPSSLKGWIKDHCMLRLDKVGFEKRDEKLIEDCGACTGCPKRTGNNKSLFSDIEKGDYCTDASCFNKKVEAHINNVLTELHKKEKSFVLLSDSYRSSKPNALDNDDYKKLKKGEACKGAVTGVMVEGEERGKEFNVCTDKSCTKHWQKWERPSSSSGGKVQQSPDERYFRKIEIIAEKERSAMVQKLINTVGTIDYLNDEMKRLIGLKLYDTLDWNHQEEFAKMKDVEADNIAERDEGVRNYIAGCANLSGLIIELTFLHGLSFTSDNILRDRKATALYEFAQYNLLSFSDIETQVKPEFDTQREKALQAYIKKNGIAPGAAKEETPEEEAAA
jgi:ParB family chromosome partitioning protein